MKHSDTLITLFYGLYCVKPHNMKPIRLVVMSNMFDMVVHEVYDVKGSTHGRITQVRTLTIHSLSTHYSLQETTKKLEGVVLKDLDLGFEVHTQLQEKIINQLQVTHYLLTIHSLSTSDRREIP